MGEVSSSFLVLRVQPKPTKKLPGRSKSLPMEIAFAGLLLAGFLGRDVAEIATAGLPDSAGVTGSRALGLRGDQRNHVVGSAKGTYTITFTGTDPRIRR